MKALRALLHECIDYAGLFPPASLPFEAVVTRYAAYRAGPDAWALGNLVLPVRCVPELLKSRVEGAADWPVSVVLGGDYGAEIREVTGLGTRLRSVECRPARLEHVSEIRRRLPEGVRLFIEPPLGFDLDEVLAAITNASAFAKIRTGGTTAEAIPTVEETAAFLIACARRGLRFKATAGLHHATRGTHPLTYGENAPQAMMHGYMNVLVAAMLAHSGEGGAEVGAVLAEETASRFEVRCDGVGWRDRRWSVDEIRQVRETFAMSFGSCSFEEPLEEAHRMGWLDERR